MTDLNGHAQEIHENVITIRDKLLLLEEAIDKLANTGERVFYAIKTASNTVEQKFDALTHAVETSTGATERIVKYVMDANEKTVAHVKNALPVRFVLVICGIIVLAFVGGGVLKELIDSHILTKLITGI